MPVEIKRQSFSDCEVLDIQGVKQGRGNPMNTVRLKFDNLYNLKEFQNELNNLFPENVTVDEKYKEPKKRRLLPFPNRNTALKRRMGMESNTIPRQIITISSVSNAQPSFNQRTLLA